MYQITTGRQGLSQSVVTASRDTSIPFEALMFPLHSDSFLFFPDGSPASGRMSQYRQNRLYTRLKKMLRPMIQIPFEC